MSVPEIAERAARAGLRLPTALTVAITDDCNLRCSHCWIEAGTRTSAGHAPARGVLRLVDGFVALGVDTVWITGGEPLRHPDWLAILSHCCAQRSVRVVGLQTNGALLDDRRVARLRALPVEKLQLDVSLDGASPRTHDRVRGRGSFAETLAALTRLMGAGLGGRTAIAFTEMHHNMDDVPALLELVDRLRLRGLVGGTLVRDGRAARNALQPPTPAQYRTLLSLYHAEARVRELYDRYGRCCAVEWWNGRSGARGDACTFFDHPYVSAGGKAYPCRLCRADELAVAGAFDRRVEAVLDDAIPRWQRLLQLARSRSAALGACQECAANLTCAGGCMGRALATRGRLAAREDRCELRRAIHGWEPRGDAERRAACGSHGPRPERISAQAQGT